MRKILLFGAGKSATVLIDYLLQLALAENWMLVVVDADQQLAEEKIGNALGGQALSFDIKNDPLRAAQVAAADIVISLLPPALHILVAKDCVALGKNLLTASYVDGQIRALEPELQQKGLLFLCEMGLDPGIDHMSAKKLIDEIHGAGGVIRSFVSHCGGLVAPESDNNPWRYKISWNPRNVVMAGKQGALFLYNGQANELPYAALFAEKRPVPFPGFEQLCWYPNRDSLPYLELYALPECETFIRTTLRFSDFIYGWKNIIELHLTDEEKIYQTDGMTLQGFFRAHLQRHGFGSWIQEKMQEQFRSSQKILEDLVNLVELQDEVSQVSTERVEQFMMVTNEGSLKDIDLEELKTAAAATVAAKMHDAKLTLSQLFYLGMDDAQTRIDRGLCSAADVLQFALEKKLSLQPGDKDLVLMQHEINYELDGMQKRIVSSFALEGENDHHTAMAKTVGLPLGIAAKLILNGDIKETGLQIPVGPQWYEPVLKELEKHGVRFREAHS